MFVSDLPAVDDDWVKPRSLAECDGCSACADKCPTDAIGRDRFVLHAEKYLTWYNQDAGEFPDWIKPSWHNCLVGCMRCQLCCPVNGPFLGWFEDAAEFSEEETALILAGSPADELPDEMARKLQRLYLLEDLPLVSRNLRVLLSRRRS